MKAFNNEPEVDCLSDIKQPNYCFPNFLLKKELGEMCKSLC